RAFISSPKERPVRNSTAIMAAAIRLRTVILLFAPYRLRFTRPVSGTVFISDMFFTGPTHAMDASLSSIKL
ncbi:MAG: hypothetical protein ILP23_03950, partial [Paludibacteraceae bacterium]|nr:hypothetical protein [Paludibacteraceae bacterium]